MGKVLAFINQKGGGKTTSAVNVGLSLGRFGIKNVVN